AMYPCPNKIAEVYEPLDGSPDPKTLKAGQKQPAKAVLGTIAVRGYQSAGEDKSKFLNGLTFGVGLTFGERKADHLKIQFKQEEEEEGRSAHFLRHPPIYFPPLATWGRAASASPNPFGGYLGGGLDNPIVLGNHGNRFLPQGGPGGQTQDVQEQVQELQPVAGIPMPVWDREIGGDHLRVVAANVRNVGVIGGGRLNEKMFLGELAQDQGPYVSSMGRIQFAPVFVSPEMEWAIPQRFGLPLGYRLELNEGRNEFRPPIQSKIPYISRLF